MHGPCAVRLQEAHKERRLYVTDQEYVVRKNTSLVLYKSVYLPLSTEINDTENNDSFVGLSFSELNQLMPDVDGGTGQYLLAGMGPMASMMGNLSAYVITQILSLTAEITLCGTVITQLFFPNVDNRIISMILLVALFLVNLKGVDLFAKVQDVVVVALVGSMILLGIISFFKLGDPSHLINYKAEAPSFKEIGGFKGIMDNMALAFWLLIGVEFIIPEAKNLKNPKRDVLLSMIVALLLLFGVQSLLGSGMTNYVSLKGLAADPNSRSLSTQSAECQLRM